MEPPRHDDVPRLDPLDLPLAQFPASTVPSPGAHVVVPDLTPRLADVRLDVPYAVKDGATLRLHVLAPPGHLDPDGDVAPVPVVVYVQGSAWLVQEQGYGILPMAQVAQRGFVVVMVEYRPSTTAPFPAQIRDLNTAIDAVVAQAPRYGGDPSRLVLWGDSSGGHTVAGAALTAGDPWFHDGEPGPREIACVVEYFAPVDIRLMNAEPSTVDHRGASTPEGLLIGGHDVGAAPKLAEATVLTRYVDPARPLPPFLIAHGTKDRLVPFGQSVLLHEALRAAGHESELYRVEGADHGGPAFWSPSFLDVVERFIREALARPS